MRGRDMERWAAVTVAVAVLVAHVHAACPNQCSGHGRCNTDFTCSCFDGWKAADCSLRACPKGKAWAEVANEDDVAHRDNVECSNMGECEIKTGVCKCRTGFEGMACEKVACPKACSGHGVCMSLSDAAAERNDRTLVRSTTYDGVWDADMVYGCVCDEGYTGYDCSQRACLWGDDPLTTGQADEVQAVACQCSAPCAGYFTLAFRDQFTAPLLPSSTAADLKAALEALPNVISVTVASLDPWLCGSSTAHVTNVTFTHNPGDLPLMRIHNQLTSGDGSLQATVNITEVVTGEKEWLECGGRGVCARLLGLCECFSYFGNSDGAGGAGTRVDCGRQTDTVTNCHMSCSGHGSCSGTPDYVCTCFRGWTAPDCSLRKCPFGRAWFDEATAPDTAHAPAECSNKGLCERTTGRCKCQDGWEGAACERLACPVTDGAACGGHGACLTMRELAERRLVNGEPAPVTYGSDRNAIATWDADVIQGCSCAGGAYLMPGGGVAPRYVGYDCSERGCPYGDNPHTPGVPERQRVTCRGDAGAFTLTFRRATTAPVSANASAAALQTALQALPTVGDVSVTTPGGGPVCSAAGTTSTVEFLSDFGNLPLMQVDDVTLLLLGSAGDVTVTEAQAGSKEELECSGFGVCDRSAGVCKCVRGYVSSDGFGRRGLRADCGVADALFVGSSDE